MILGPDMRETGDGKTVGLAKVVLAIIAPNAAIDRPSGSGVICRILCGVGTRRR